MLGDAHQKLKHYGQALEVYRSIIRLQPESKHLARAYDGIGRTYHAMGQYENAVSSFQEALRIDPTAGYTFLELGVSCYRLKQYPKPVEALQQAVRLEPSDGMAHFNLGYIYFRMGMKEERKRFTERFRLSTKRGLGSFSLR